MFVLTQVANSSPAAWQKTKVGDGIINSDTATVTARIESGVRYVGGRFDADVIIRSGFYTDFVPTGVSRRAAARYANFGYCA